MWNKRLSVFSNDVSIYGTRPKASPAKLEFLVFIQLLLWIILAKAQNEKIPWTHVAHFHFYIVNLTAIIFTYRKMYSWLNRYWENVRQETWYLQTQEFWVIHSHFRAAHLCKNRHLSCHTHLGMSIMFPSDMAQPREWEESGLSLLQASIAAGSSYAWEWRSLHGRLGVFSQITTYWCCWWLKNLQTA